MSVDVIQPSFMLPLKRARESITLSDDSVSKCGELFVTNCADKWTFYCTYCQKATTDIGVFICHIRLEHLNEQQDLQQSHQTPPAIASNVSTIQNDLNVDRSSSGTPIECSLASEEPAANAEQQQPMESHMVKEEPTVVASGQEHFDYEPISTTVSKIVDISALTQPASNETEDGTSNKIDFATSTNNFEEQTEKELFALTTLQQENKETTKTIEVVCISDDNINEDENTDGNDTCYSVSDDDDDNDDDDADDDVKANGTEFENIADDDKASCSSSSIAKNFRCTHCGKCFTSDVDLHVHIGRNHYASKNGHMPLQCHKCNKGFRSANGLKGHLKLHEGITYLQCPICTEKLKNKNFATHVLLHESDTCFPCQVCGKIHKSNAERLKHWETHAEDQPFGCNICYRRYKRQKYLIKHIKYHRTNNRKGRPIYKKLNHACDYCNRHFKTPKDLQHHVTETHDTSEKDQLPIKCPECKKGFKSANGLRGHLKLHGDNIYIKCPLCKVKINEKDFATHVVLHEEAEHFPCQVCGQTYKTTEERLTHWQTHAAELPFGCDFCYRRFKIFLLLSDHLKCHPAYTCYLCEQKFTATQTERPPHVCGKCNKLPNVEEQVKRLRTENAENQSTLNTNEDSNTTENMEVVTSDSNTNDDDSDLEFINETETNSGISSHYIKATVTTPNKPDIKHYKCVHCRNIYTSKEAITFHLAKTHCKYDYTIYRFKCDRCIKSFRSKSGLDMHQKTHDKTKQNQCSVCQYVDFRRSSFARHVLTHANESCFPCQDCGKIFPNKAERLVHWKAHAKERPYVCEICQRRFLYKHFHKAHMKAHGLYYCNFCPQHFNSERSLQPPYVCGNCEKLPEIKSIVEHQRSLSSKKHVFESDEGE